MNLKNDFAGFSSPTRKCCLTWEYHIRLLISHVRFKIKKNCCKPIKIIVNILCEIIESGYIGIISAYSEYIY